MKEKGKVLITGASRGIGRAAAEKFAKEGHPLFLCARRSETELAALCKELSETYGVSCRGFMCDVSDFDMCAEMFGEAGDIDILINNAGISYVGLLQKMDPLEWKRVIDTNLGSVFNCCKLAIQHMVSQKHGSIVNVSSVWGVVGGSCEAAYSASKGGVNALTKALARELAPSGVRVNAVAPGVIDTDMNACLGKSERDALAGEIGLGRFGTPGEVAELIYELAAGRSSSYITGQIVTIDGGWPA